jgi:hypothetical protein
MRNQRQERSSSQREGKFRQLETFEEPQTDSREEEFCRDTKLLPTFVNLYREIEKGFQDQSQRSDDIENFWDCYNCKLNHNQFYNGTSAVYVPIIYDAINARKTRFTNQIFPQSQRYVDVISEDAKNPSAVVSLLEYYCRVLRLQTDIVPPLIKQGDVEGQYTLYVSWEKDRKDVAYRVERPKKMEVSQLGIEEEDISFKDLEGLPDPEETVYDIVEETIVRGHPSVEIISDADLLVLPVTAQSIEDAINSGGSVTVIRRWSKGKIQAMMDEGHIDKEFGKALTKDMSTSKFGLKNSDKSALDSAGIKGSGASKLALVYETWTKFKIKGKSRIYRIYFGGANRVLGCKRNPYWSDNIPIISCAVEKLKGSFKGKSKVDPVASFQYSANDACNMGYDSAQYALLPITMTDPEKNPNIGSFVLSMAAIWMTNPNDTQFAQMPPLWKDALELIAASRAQIFQSLGVNPAIITQSANTKRRLNQAEIAAEQQVDILTTADAVTVIEAGILTPMLHRFLELDHQYRNKKMTIMEHGHLGVQANMEEIPPVAMNTRHYIKWFGVESARNAQQIQQQIAAANVLRGIPPQLYEGHKLDLVPVITQLVENTFGPRIAPLVFKDMKSQMSVDPEEENKLISMGIDFPVSPFDNHQMHVQAHLRILQQTGDPHGTVRAHLQEHQQAVMAAMQQQMEQGQQQPGVPGTPGGAGPGVPGQPGQPRMGAQTGVPRVQGPPGMIHQDQMVDAGRMPR